MVFLKMAIFLFGPGEGYFLYRVNCFSFSTGGGGSPLLGENNAFMAEPSDRPAIKNEIAKLKG